MKEHEKNIINEVNDEEIEEMLEKDFDKELMKNSDTWFEYMAYVEASEYNLDAINSKYDESMSKIEEQDLNEKELLDKMNNSISIVLISTQTTKCIIKMLAYAQKGVKPIPRMPIVELLDLCQLANNQRNDSEALSITLKKIEDVVTQINGLLDDILNKLSVDAPETYEFCCEHIKKIENSIRESLQKSNKADEFDELNEFDEEDPQESAN